MIDLCRLKDFACNEGASEEALVTLKETYPGLPEDYLSFLRSADGGEGFVGPEYLIIWRASEIKQFNFEYESHIYAAELLIFGSSGGGEAYAFDTRQEPWSIVSVPFIGMSLRYAVQIGTTFCDFLEQIAKIPS